MTGESDAIVVNDRWCYGYDNNYLVALHFGILLFLYIHLVTLYIVYKFVPPINSCTPHFR